MAVNFDIGAPKAWVLSGPDEMFEAAKELSAEGYRGEIAWYLPTEEQTEITWKLTLNSETPGTPEVIAFIGEGLLLVAGVLRKLTDEEMTQV